MESAPPPGLAVADQTILLEPGTLGLLEEFLDRAADPAGMSG
jgi:hypothetical protein